MIVPDAKPFSERSILDLNYIRQERLNFKTQSYKKEKKAKKDDLMDRLLKSMTPEQMKGYLKGLNKKEEINGLKGHSNDGETGNTGEDSTDCGDNIIS